VGFVVAQHVTERPSLTLAHLALVDRSLAYRRQQQQATLPASWDDWLTTVFPDAFRPPFAAYHAEFWRWVWNIQADQPASPFVAIWPRGGGKSQSAETACAVVAAQQSRRYVLYVCETQDRADTHVQNVAALLESPIYAKHFPRQAARRVGKYGNSQGWRRNRIRTESGLTVDAIGLDTAARGAKVDEDRPDLIICDDLDGLLDTPGTVTRKIQTLTKSLLPARASHGTVLVVQNLIHADGIVAQLADGRADFLADRIVSGPHPAIDGAVFAQDEGGKWRITEGRSTWDALTLADLQRELDDIGISAFRAEKQHDVSRIEGGIFGHLTYRHCKWADVPPLDRIVVWVDPAVTDTDQSDAHGIQADGLARDGTIYRLYSWEARTSPEDAIRRAVLKAVELRAESVGVETDQGGDTWISVYDRVIATLGLDPATAPEFKQAKAGARGPKAHRASQMLADYERGAFVHVTGTHETLERALSRYLLRKPYDLVDAAFWSWADLRTEPTGVQIL
jgi:hypothetical protein